MKHGVRVFGALALVATLGGCIARTAMDVVTAPVKVVSRSVDLVTTSQSESDEKRGRDLRRREEQLGKLERQQRREVQRCEQGDAEACQKAEAMARDIELLLPSVPATMR
ncbi:hypothetical protein [Novosphingobium sp.]|uniref:hypothetical protein n=1 Tax=Novosphingobium sp. TaxID=1874826 RepID=UPI0025E81B9F|nr:hypothetical protein [Novosphingobium sp.]